MLAVVAAIGAFIGLVFGKFSWVTPPWLDYFKQKAAANPKACRTFVAGFILLAAVIAYGYYWYTTRPQPERITAQIIIPKVTPVDKVLVPDSLTINFGVLSNNELSARSVAPLDMVGRNVTDAIRMTPAMAGQWYWQSDSQLSFMPEADWPAGQTYTIRFDKPFFSKGANMADWSYTFQTLPFKATIKNFKLYIDPVNPQVRQAVAELDFNFPVDAASLEDDIEIRWQAYKNTDFGASSKRLKFSLKYDDNKRIAYLRSEEIPLPDVERYLTLSLGKGIKAANGPSATPEAVSDKILIADAASYFKITKAGTAIVRNQKDRPEQVLTIETTLGVTQDELDKSLQVYLLPQDYPASAAEQEIKNYQWKNPGEVSPAILALAKPVTLVSIPADRDYATLHSYKYNAAAPGYLYVKIDKGMRGFGKYSLLNPYAAVMGVPEYPKEISFLHKGALLALGSDEKLSVVVRGLPAVKFMIARVLPQDVNHLVTQTGGDFSNPYFKSYYFNQDNISQVVSQVQQFDNSDPAKQQYTALDLGKYLGNGSLPQGPLGLFLLQAQGWNVKDNVPLYVDAKRLVLITDLGLITKDNNDGSHDVFVQSISKGTPVANAAVSILGKNGVAVLTKATDAQGRVNFPTFKDFINEREPTVYVARINNDVSFIPYNRPDRKLNLSRFDIGGITSNTDTALTAFVFTDRGIYRPGDTAHIGMIIKQPYVVPQSAGVPLEVDIIDPRGTTVKVEKITLNDSGYMTLDFPTNAVSSTGQYLVNVYIVKDNQPGSLIGSASMNVQEFLPDRLRLTTAFVPAKPAGWLSPVGLKEKIGLWNLYGAPAAGHRIAGKILLAPRAVTFTQFPDYIFLDPLLNPKSPPKVFSDNLSETKTDSKGEAEVDLNLDRFEKATYQLTVFTEGFEAEGGRSVSSQISSLVSPLKYLVGYKADGDLNYIRQHGTRSVRIIAVNPDLQLQALGSLHLKLFNLRPVTSLVKNEDDTYEYKSIIQTTEVSNTPFAIDAKGSEYPLPAKEIGDYLVSVVDDSQTELAKFKFSIVGESQQPIPKNAELNVKLSKAEYEPGEEIELQITAPYTGSGLVTIERDHVYASQWITTTTTSSVHKIHVPADFKGNGYINVAFVRDYNSPEIFMSPLSYSVVPFAVTHKNESIKVDLTAPKMVKPGDTVNITYQTDKPGKIIVFAVDEGILQVSRYATPDPLKFFFQKRALEVDTMQIVDQILPKFMADRELSAVGGDEGEAALNRNLNPFKRKTEAPVVFWSGIMDTDTAPHQLSYLVPDYFNGSLRIMAVAVANEAVGSNAVTTEVRGDFVINPNVPTFVAPGDEFEVTASIANNVEGSGANSSVQVTLSATPQLTILGEASQRIDIPEGQERSVRYKLRAASGLGAAELKLLASMNGKAGRMTSSLSVRPPVAYATSVNSGFSKDNKKSVSLERDLYPEYRNVQAQASASPLILVTGLQRYLDDYPYGCVEQLISKALPWVAMAKQPGFAADAQSMQEKIQKTIQMLGQRQMTSGGFSYWPEVGSTSNNEFASVYAMHFLLEARAQGYSVPQGMYTAGITYLKDQASQNASTLEQARNIAYAIYLLTRNEIVTTNYLTNLQLTLDQNKEIDWKSDITSAYMAATYQLLKSSDMAEKMIAYYKPQTAAKSDSYDFYNQNIADAQYFYLIAKHFPERLVRMGSTLVPALVSSLNDSTISTVLSGYATLALSAYYQPGEAQTSPLVISETTKDGAQVNLSAADSLYQQVKINAGASAVNFSNPSRQVYFYQVVQAGFDKTLPKTAEMNGIEVYRELTNDNHSTVSEVKLGDEIVVTIRARATDNQYHNNVAIVDLLPGGFEVVRASLNSQNMDYVDIREDRVIFFGSVEPQSREITYRIKATSAGQFVVPPVFGKSMYNPVIKAQGTAGNMTVNNND